MTVTQSEIHLDVDLEEVLKCDAQQCDNEAVWLRKHEGCTRLTCDECRDQIIRDVTASLDEDVNFWCPKCEMSEPPIYWAMSLRWFLI